jgi:Protein of unknown function (DUF3489)
MEDQEMTAVQQTKRAGTAFAGKAPAKARKTPGVAGSRAAKAVLADRGEDPRSKRALLVDRLGRPEGARIDDLTRELGWLPHTVRAALTGLRRKGYVIARERTEGEASVYRATPPVAEKSPTTPTAKKRSVPPSAKKAPRAASGRAA